MPRITYVSADGSARTTLELPLGTSVMRGAVTHDVPGIVARCGGNAQCGTCHVHVLAESTASPEPVRPDEDAMLDFTACRREPDSRLSCRLRVTEALDGLVVRVAERQL